MAQTSPAKANSSKAPAGPKVSGTRTIISLALLVVVLIVCAIELRAGLGQFLTLKAYEKISENNLFKKLSYQEAHGMVAAFPSKKEVQTGEFEDTHHYYWYSLLRPLMGEKHPELFLTVDHSEPQNAISFYTSTEGEIEHPPYDPNAVPATAPTMGPMSTDGMSGMGGGRGMGGGGGDGSGRGRQGGDRKGAAGDRPAMEGDDADTAAAEPTTNATEEPAATTPETTEEPAKSDAPAVPN